MKRIGGLWEKLVSFENLHEAVRRAALGKKNRPDVAAFLLEQDTEIVRLRQELESGRYQPGPYRQFPINEPKPRLISAAPFRDRVVDHALTQVLEPIFERRFSKDSFACRQGLGTHTCRHPENPLSPERVKTCLTSWQAANSRAGRRLKVRHYADIGRRQDLLSRQAKTPVPPGRRQDRRPHQVRLRFLKRKRSGLRP
jgi:hypothetical protein